MHLHFDEKHDNFMVCYERDVKLQLLALDVADVNYFLLTIAVSWLVHCLIHFCGLYAHYSYKLNMTKFNI